MKRLSRNELRTVRTIFAQQHPTRSSIARRTRLSLVKISSILKDLEKKGYIQKVGKKKTTGGRPAYLFQLKPGIGVSIGVSIAPNSFEVVASDAAKGAVVEERHPLALPEDPEMHVPAIVEQVSSVLKNIMKAQLDDRPVVSVGIALPGMVDTKRGIWLLGLQVTGITHIGLARLFEQRLSVPVWIEDASRALTILHMYSGVTKRVRNFVLVYIGIGLGTGIVIDGKIYRGFHGLAGEIGHVIHADNSYRCSCNNVGCLDTVVSTSGILKVFRDRLQEGVHSVLQRAAGGEDPELGLKQILDAADGGDRLAISTLAEIGAFLGDGCAILIKLFNPEALIVSGPGTVFKQYFREPVQQTIQQRVLPEMLEDYRLLFSDYQPEHEARGASLLAMKCYLQNLTRTLTGVRR